MHSAAAGSSKLVAVRTVSGGAPAWPPFAPFQRLPLRTAGSLERDALEVDAHVGARVGPYLLLEQIGAGGMCLVHRARHLLEGSDRAVKVLQPGRRGDSVLAERLRREALAGLRVSHPNVVRVVENGEMAGGPYVVMELLSGRTLHEVLATQGRLTPARAARITRQVAEGLAATHRAGLVHRDLKPGNIMLVTSADAPGGERVKILDLGIVRLAEDEDAPAAAQLTQTDLVVGTPSYMAPEQFQTSHVGPEADLYALGVVLYQMISGRLPYEGGFQQIISQQLIAPPNPLQVAEGLDELAFWLLERRPEDRPTPAQVIRTIDVRFPKAATSPAIAAAPTRAWPIGVGIPVAPPPGLVACAPFRA